MAFLWNKLLEKRFTGLNRWFNNGGVGLFYYAGHAVQVRGTNHLIPIGAQIESESDVNLVQTDFSPECPAAAAKIFGRLGAIAFVF